MHTLCYKFLIYFGLISNLLANPATPEETTRLYLEFSEKQQILGPKSSCMSQESSDLTEEVNRCGWTSSSPQDIWRNLDGSKSASLENGKIVLTYSLAGCPDTSKFTSSSYPSCEEYQKEINEVFEFFQQQNAYIQFRRVDTNANIAVDFGDASANAFVERYNSNNQILPGLDPAEGNRFHTPEDEKNRSARSTILINSNKCHWITDRSICQPPNRRKPIETPDIKTLVLHELMHAIGFKHTRCDMDLSIVSPYGGHGHYHLNSFDSTMINMYYSEVVSSYQ